MNFADTWSSGRGDEGNQWPLTDGPAVAIHWDTNSPGFRRILAADGNPETPEIKYLLEIACASNTSGIARTHKLYTYNIKTGVLTFVHTIAGLPNVGTPSYGGSAFTINYQNGYYVYDYNSGFYVIDLVTGAVWGYQNISAYYSLNESGGLSKVLFLANGKDFFYLYMGSDSKARAGLATVDTSTETVTSWGTQTVLSYSTYSVSSGFLFDPRVGQPSGQYIITAYTYTAGGTYYAQNSTVNINDGTISTTIRYSASSSAISQRAGSRFFLNDKIVIGGYKGTNMQYYTYDPSVATNAPVTTLSSWGTCSANGADNLKQYHSPGNILEYTTLCDINQDAWFTRSTPGVGVFGSPVFRATNIVTGIAVSGYAGGNFASIIPCKKGFFYVGQISNTTKVAPVIWYYLAD